MTSRATLVFANHRPETIPAAQRLMVHHDAVILEESPDPQFLPMLNGQVPIDAYLETVSDAGWPESRYSLLGSFVLDDLVWTATDEGTFFESWTPSALEAQQVPRFSRSRFGDFR